jgi:hypothetical protein
MKAKSLPFIAFEHKRFVRHSSSCCPRARAHLGFVLTPEFVSDASAAARGFRARVVYSTFFFSGDMFVRLFSCPGISIRCETFGPNSGNAAARSPHFWRHELMLTENCLNCAFCWLLQGFGFVYAHSTLHYRSWSYTWNFGIRWG